MSATDSEFAAWLETQDCDSEAVHEAYGLGEAWGWKRAERGLRLDIEERLDEIARIGANAESEVFRLAVEVIRAHLWRDE